MASESSLSRILAQLSSQSPNSSETSALLSKAKLILLHLNALIPTPTTSPHLLSLARQTLESGALVSIRAQDPDAFTRYYHQLQPFYDLPASAYRGPASTPQTSTSAHASSPSSRAASHLHHQPHSHHGHSATGKYHSDPAYRHGQRSKVTGLYLLLLLTKGDYAGFHTVLEGLLVDAGAAGQEGLDGDKFLRYPVMLEQWLMEGAYDRVWAATKKEEVPSEEFGVFTEVLVHTIRAEIASCSEKAYPSLPIPNAKNLLFLDSEGAVVEFAQNRNWLVRDGRIYFPSQEAPRTEKEILVASSQVIENVIGYARELETIV